MNLIELVSLLALFLVSVYGPTGTTAFPFRIGQQCIPGEQKTVACNSCACDELGMWVCTHQYCDPNTGEISTLPVCTPLELKIGLFKICQCDESGSSWNCFPINCFTELPTIDLNGRNIEHKILQANF